jgi:hypothetical protein
VKKINYQVYLIAFWLIIALASCKQSKTGNGLSDQFITSEKSKIELAVDNNSIQLKAAGLGGFSQCKPYFAWRNEGVEKWTEDLATTIGKTKISDRETRLTCPVGPVMATINIKQLDDNIFEFSGNIKNTSAKTIEMARFHYLNGTVDDIKSCFISYSSFGVHKNTDTLAPSHPKNEKNMPPHSLRIVDLMEN